MTRPSTQVATAAARPSAVADQALAPVGAKTRRGSVVLPSLLSGVLMALSVPPWGFWPLAFAGGALFWWRLGGLGPRSRLLAGWALGLGLFLPGLWWATSFNVYGGIVLIVIESLLAPGVAALVTPPGAGRSVALPGAMVLGEAIRSHWPFGGLPMGSIALGQAASPLAACARLGGPLLVIGVTWLVGIALGALAVTGARRWLGRRAPIDPAAGAVSTAAAATGAIAVGGSTVPGSAAVAPAVTSRRTGLVAVTAVVVGIAVVLGATLAPAGGPTVGEIRVAAVQGGGRRGVSHIYVSPATVFDAQLAATAMIGAVDRGRPPTLVLWPEDVVALPGPLSDSQAKPVLAELARRHHASMVVGVTEDVGAAHFRNEAVAFSPSGSVIGHYEKVHRVPFGEYIPYRSFFSHLANLSAVPRNAIPGHGDGVLRVPGAVLGTMISFEVFFPDRGRDPVVHGADLLVVPTNTSSYATSQVPTQEVAADQLQAIAEGRYLVQAAPSGYSDVVTPHGAVLQRSVLGRRQVLVADVGLRHGLTVFARLGEVPTELAAGFFVAAGWLLWWRRRRTATEPWGWRPATAR